MELPPSLGEYARAFFEKRGIEVRLGTGVREATGTAIVTSTGEVIGTRTVVATIGNAPTPMVAKLDLPNDRGRVRTDRALRVEGRGNVWALGDAALIPLVDAPSAREHYAPPTAQFAVREARRLAENVRAVLEGRQPEPFVYTSKGALASLGGGRGVAEVFGVRLSGFPAWLLWRGYYLSFVPGFATKVRILVQWVLDLIVGRSTVQTGAVTPRATRYVRYRAGDRVFEEGNRADGFYAVIEGAFELTVTRPGRGRDGPADRTRRALRRAGAARRGASHRHGAGARGFAGAGGRRRGLPAADPARCRRSSELLRRLYRRDLPARSRSEPAQDSCARAARDLRRTLVSPSRMVRPCVCWTPAARESGGGDGHAMTGAAEIRAIFPARSERARASGGALRWAHGGTTGTVWSAGARVAIGRDNESGLVGDNVGEQRHERHPGS